MRTTPVKLGIIGCGVIGTQHLQAATAAPQINVAAIADLRDNVLRDTAAKFNIPRTYTDAHALLADPGIEAVIFALPTAGRTELALRALAAGKHILIEKPGGMNAGELRQLIAARGDRVAGCCQSRLRLPASARAATDFVATGALGKLRVIRCRALKPAGPPPTSPPPAWRLNKSLNGGGIFVNWGCYDLDYLLGITGWRLQPRRVFAHAWPIAPKFAAHAAPGSDAETHILAHIQCTDDCVITYERGEFTSAQPDEAWSIVGENGTLRLPMIPAPGKKIHFDEGVTTRVIWEGDEPWGTGPTVTVDFAQAILEGRPPYATLENALTFQQIVDAAYASAATGRAIDIA